MRTRRWTAGSWPESARRRPRVLIENADAAEQWACERILREADYEVAVCGGPDAHDSPCPLVERGSCELAAGADVVVNGFRLAPRRNQDVIVALTAHFPGTPVMVEATKPEAERHADLLAGAAVVPWPQTKTDLLANVHGALADRPKTSGC